MSEHVKIRIIALDKKEYYCWSFSGKNLWEAMSSCAIDTGGSCGGKGKCGRCKVRVEGDISPLGDVERELLLPEEIKQGLRLACYCIIYGPTTVYIENGNTDYKIKEHCHTRLIDYQQNAQVQNRTFFIPGIDKYEPVPIYRRIANALPGYNLELSISNLNKLSMLDRVGRPSLELNALVFNNQVVKYVGRNKKNAYGIAVDLGSTSLFTALVDLQNGQVIAVASKANMQRVYGADVISRLSYCMEKSDGLDKLHQVLINNVNGMIEDLTREAGISYDMIYSFCIVGNPVMLHFFTGLNINGFAAVPYAGLFIDELNYRANDLGIKANQDAFLLILPQIGGFIGADTVACLLNIPASVTESSCYILIDIGTNGEIVLCNNGTMWAASAAAGPAFEGGNITSGMRAGNGAIDKVFLDDDNNLSFNVLGNIPAKGICGSAIIDITACMLKAGIIDQNGIFTEKCKNLNMRDSNRGVEIILIDSRESFKGTPVVFNQEDIRQVQLAKGAIRTAIDILLKEAGLEYTNLDNIYLAGTFGAYLNPEHCTAMGLLPPVNIDKIINMGNAAGKGAITALLCQDQQENARIIKEQVQYIELANHPDFQEMFLNNLGF